MWRKGNALILEKNKTNNIHISALACSYTSCTLLLSPVIIIILYIAIYSPSLDSGYKPNTVYSTRYRDQTYPTLHTQTSNHSDNNSKHGSQGQLDQRDSRLEGSLDSGFSSTNNMYNVNSLRTSRYESSQDLGSPSESQSENLDILDKLSLNSKPGSLTSAYKQSQNCYGSLERNMNRRANRASERKLSDTDTASEASTISASKYGKRTSRSEYDLSSKGRESDKEITRNELDLPPFHGQRNLSLSSGQNAYQGSRSDTRFNSRHDSSNSHRLIEVPVKHETARSSTYRTDRKGWQDIASTEPSPIIQSPTKKNFSDNPYGSSSGGSGDASQGQCYSPRGYEGSRGQPPPKPPHSEPHNVTVRYIGPSGVTQSIPSKIVTVQRMSPHVEVSKPFEMKDFYKYSEKLRRQRLVEQYHQALVGSRASTPSQHSSDGDSHSTSYHMNSHGLTVSHHGPSTPTSHPAYRSTASPISSRHMVSNYPSHSGSHDDSSQHGYSNPQSNSQFGVSTTTSRVQYTVQTQGGRVLYKAQHQSSKQTHYQPPSNVKCEPVHGASHEAPASSPTR